MSKMAYLFPLKELKKMDQQHLEMLNDAIQHHLHNSPEIKKILKAKVSPVYARLKQSKGSGRGKKPGRSKA